MIAAPASDRTGECHATREFKDRRLVEFLLDFIDRLQASGQSLCGQMAKYACIGYVKRLH